jgi:hypothetical protein
MKIEFDPKKRESTLRARKLDFEDAKEVFDGTEITIYDDRADYGEERYITIGVARGEVVVIVWTPRDRGEGEVVRIISMRQANDKESKAYWEQVR